MNLRASLCLLVGVPLLITGLPDPLLSTSSLGLGSILGGNGCNDFQKKSCKIYCLERGYNGAHNHIFTTFLADQAVLQCICRGSNVNDPQPIYSSPVYSGSSGLYNKPSSGIYNHSVSASSSGIYNSSASPSSSSSGIYNPSSSLPTSISGTASGLGLKPNNPACALTVTPGKGPLYKQVNGFAHKLCATILGIPVKLISQVWSTEFSDPFDGYLMMCVPAILSVLEKCIGILDVLPLGDQSCS